MPASSTDAAFERVLAAVGQCLDRRSAEALLRLRADREMQGRIEELAGLDPESGALVRLFHPRQDQWDEHFERNGVIIVGRTTIGRATVGLR